MVTEPKEDIGEEGTDKARPGLAPAQKRALLEAIRNVMEREDVYCDTDFSLGKLASLVNSNSKYVSQVINEHYRKNFNAYLNVYRIRTARARLADRKNYGNYTIKPKSVIRHAESVFDWESEAFGHLARLCPHPDSRYAST